MQQGDIIGHRFMESSKLVVVNNLKVGDRVVVPSTMAVVDATTARICGRFAITRTLTVGLKLAGITSAIYGYSHLLGGYAGAQAEYVRVPLRMSALSKFPKTAGRKAVVHFHPHRLYGCRVCDIQPGDTVAVWGCSAVGQFAMISAYDGCRRVIAIDRFPERLQMAKKEQSGSYQLRRS